eukprot:COSAG05_NODE_2043_length_3647_cov_2.893461_4_plen_527_part_00
MNPGAPAARQPASGPAAAEQTMSHDTPGPEELARAFSDRAPSSAVPEAEPPDQPSAGAPAPAQASELHVKTASDNSWKAWAGRREGGEGFIFSDLYHGVAKSLSNIPRQWKGDSRSRNKPCPVCFDEEPPLDALGKRWMRLYCGCTVCSTCVRHWNVSQMEGALADAVVKLSCPVCRALMRPADAAQTLERCSSVARRHDLQSRDAALRRMADGETGLQEWHPCPHCKTGGGFITSTCIRSRHAAVRAQIAATELQGLWHTVAAAEAAAAAQQVELDQAVANRAWFALHASGRLEETLAVLAGAPLATVLAAAAGLPKLAVGLAAGVALPLLLGHKLSAPQEDIAHARQHTQASALATAVARQTEEEAAVVAQRAAAAALRSELLEVGCPCCEGVFQLPESSLEHREGKLSAMAWMDINTRGCPECGAFTRQRGLLSLLLSLFVSLSHTHFLSFSRALTGCEQKRHHRHSRHRQHERKEQRHCKRPQYRSAAADLRSRPDCAAPLRGCSVAHVINHTPPQNDNSDG